MVMASPTAGKDLDGSKTRNLKFAAGPTMMALVASLFNSPVSSTSASESIMARIICAPTIEELQGTGIEIVALSPFTNPVIFETVDNSISSTSTFIFMRSFTLLDPIFS